jgi:hypothetical protein
MQVVELMATTFRVFVLEQDLLLPPTLRHWLPEELA